MRIGDAVVVGIAEDALLRASIWVYLVPFVAMLAAGAFAHIALSAHDLLVAAFALTGLVGGFALTRAAAQRLTESGGFQPVLVRRIVVDEDGCPRLG